jgi:hypothetical protein
MKRRLVVSGAFAVTRSADRVTDTRTRCERVRLFGGF